MQSKIVFCLLLFAPALLWGGVNFNVSASLSLLGIGEGACPECSTEKSYDPQACLRDICGEPSESKDYVTEITELLGKYTEMIKSDPLKVSKLAPLLNDIETMVKNSIDRRKSALNLIKNEYETLENIKLSPLLFPIVNMEVFISLLRENQDWMEFVPREGGYKLNTQKVLKANPKFLDLKEIRYFESLVSSEGFTRLVQPSLISPEDIVNERAEASGISKEQFIQSYAIETLNRVTKLQKILPDHLNYGLLSVKDTLKLQMAANGEQLSNPDLEDLFSKGEFLFFADDLFTTKNEVIQNGNKRLLVDFKQYLAEKKKILNIDKSLEMIEKNKDELISETISDCTDQIAAQLATSPIETEKAKLKLISKVKAAMLSGPVAKLSIHSQKVITKALDRVKFRLPRTQSEELKYIQNAVQTQLDSDESNKKMSMILKKEEILFNIFYDLDEIAAQTELDAYKISLKKLCKDFKFEYMNDSAMDYKSGYVKISWQSLINEEQGQSTLAHEIGHMLSFLMSSESLSSESLKKLNETKSCIASHHPELNSYPELSTLYQEEDWADFIETQTFLSNPQNMNCFFNFKIDDTYTSTSLISDDLEVWKKDPSKKPGTHSTAFFRILHEELLKKGKLPDSCPQDLTIKKCSL